MRNSRGLRLAAILAAVTVLSSNVAWSSMVRALTASERARKADSILVGQVARLTPSWSPDGRGIVTEALVRVQTPLKHAQVEEIMHVTVPGGTVGGLTLYVEGAPTLRVGERALFYLERTRAGALELLGWRQGVQPIDHGWLAGRNAVLWDGLTDTGLAAPNDRYLVEVTANAPEGGHGRALTAASVAR